MEEKLRPHCADHGEASACLNFIKRDVAEIKIAVTSAHKRLDGVVTMKIFGILITVLVLVFGALFAVSLSTNASVSNLCVELRGMQRDIAVNTRDIDSSSREIRRLHKNLNSDNGGK